MRYRCKLSAKPVTIILVAILAAAGLLRSKHHGHILFSPIERQEPLPTGFSRVTKIVDGDTLHALITSEHQSETDVESVRLFGINAPELHPRPGQRWENFKVEPFAQEANDFLFSLCPPGTDTRIELHDRDKYGRVLGVIILKDGRDVNRLLIEAGLAKSYFMGRKDSLRQGYEEAEKLAKSAKRGIWK